MLSQSRTSSSYRPLVRHAISFLQTRHNSDLQFDVQKKPDAGPKGVAGWKLVRTGRKEHKRFKREHNKGIFFKLPDSSLENPAFEPAYLAGEPLDFSSEIFFPELIGERAVFRTSPTHPFMSFGTPRSTLIENRLLSVPTTIIRQSTLDMAEIVEHAQDKPSSKSRICYTGRSGSGKTHALLQTVQHCYNEEWIVIYIPRAFTTVNSSSTYIYDLRTQTYLQPTYAKTTLRRILTTNESQLTSLTTRQAHTFEKDEVLAGSPLALLIQAGIKVTASAPAVLDALMTELEVQEAHPVLLAVDDFQALFGKTTYKDQHFVSIASYHLSMPRLLMQFSSGQRSFARGAFFGALNASNTQFPISNDVQLALNLDAPSSHRFSSPYDKQRKSMQEYLSGILPLHIPDGMTPTEAGGLFDIWMDHETFIAEPTDELFLSKYTESSGNPRDFVWKGLLRSLGAPPLKMDDSKPFAQYNLP